MKNDFYKQVLQEAPFGFAHHEIILDEAGKPCDYRFIEVNEAFEKLTDLKKENLIGKTVREVIPGIEKSKFDWIGFYGKIAIEGGEEEFEQFSEPLGRWYRVHVYSSEKMFFTVLFIDITANRKALEDKKESEDHLTATLQSIADGVISCDIEGKVKTLNPVAETLTGWSAAEATGQPIEKIFHIINSKTGQEAENPVFRSLKEGIIVGLANHTVLISKNGTEYQIADSCAPIKNADGVVTGTVLVFRDVTEEYSQREALRVSEARFREIFFNNPQAAQLVDENGFTLQVNEAHTRLFGAVPPPDYSVFNDPLLEKQGLSGLWEKVRNGEVVYFPNFRYNTFELNPQLPDKPVWLQMTVFPLSGSEGSRGRFVLKHIDITARKHAEDALRLREERLQKQNDALLTLVSKGILFQPELQQAIAEITETCSELVGTKRVSVWLYNDDFSEIKCVNLFNSKVQQHVNNRETLRCEEFPTYFACQKKGEIIDAIDVFTDPRTCELPAAYYQEHNIRSMLDTPVWFHDRLGGVLCFEHTGEQRVWTPEDVRLATSMAALLSLCYQNEERKQAEDERESAMQMLQSALAQSPSGILIADAPDVRIRWVNEAALNIRGKSEVPLTGIDVSKHSVSWQTFRLDGTPIPSEDLPLSRAILKGETVRNEEVIIRHESGEDRYVSANSAPICNAAGDITAGIVVFHDITEMKNAEKALQDSFGKYQELSTLLRLLADNMPDMLWAKNLNKEYIFANKAICTRLLNAADTEEPLGKNDMFFALRERNSHPDNPQWHTFGEICSDSDSITLEEMKPMQFDEFGNVQGKFLFLDVRKAPLFDDQGQLIGVVGSARDVTAAREAENQLRKLSQAVEQSPASVVITDLQGNIEYVNPKFTEITGYLPDEAIGQNPRILKSGQMQDELYKELWQTISSGNDWKGEFHNKKKNGELFWESAQISPIKNEKGELLHYLAVKEDITDQKRAETSRVIQYNIARSIHTARNTAELLEVVRKELGKLFDTTNFFVARHNPENDTLRQLIFCDEKDSFDEWDANQSISGQVVKTGKTIFLRGNEVNDFSRQHNLEILGTDSACWLGVPVIMHNRAGGVMVIQHYTNPLAYSRADVALFEMVAHETGIYLEKQLMIDDLIKSKEKAEESDRLKTAFINNISHEIRTPLNGILGFGELMMDESLSYTEKLNHNQILHLSSNRLIQTVTDILDISEIRANTIKLALTEVDILQAMNDLLDETIEACANKNIHVSLSIPENCKDLVIQTDRKLFIKVAGHLLNNATKFTEQGRISFGFESSPDVITFFVKDTGMGIEEENLGMIFKPFTQEDFAITRGYEGSGLGLSIAQGMLSLLGGEIRVKSQKDIGSEFYFTLPLQVAGLVSDPGLKFKSDNKLTTSLILIAEDEISNYLYFNEILKKKGFKTLHAFNGEEAVSMCRQFPEITLIIMDIKMPVMNGLDATRLIREFRTNIPIVAVTAFAQSNDRYQAILAGCNDYITKPVKPGEFLLMIKRYL